MTLAANTRIADRLRVCGLFSSLDAGQFDALSELMVYRRYAKGEQIISRGAAGSAMYLLLHGRVKISLASLDGKELALEYVDAPGSFGEMGLAGAGVRAADVSAIGEVEVACLDAADLPAALEIHPGLAMMLLRTLSRTVRSLMGRLEDIAFNDATHRVMRVLLNVATAAYEERGLPLIEGLTHYELATLAGTSRETASRVISQLGRDGALRTKGRKIVIDILKLEEMLRVE